MNRKWLVGISVAVVAIVVGFGYYAARGEISPTSLIAVLNTNATSEKIDISGTYMASAMWYKGYEVEYGNGALYIKIRGSSIHTPGTYGEFTISLPNTYGNVNSIYLQGASHDDVKLVWHDGKMVRQVR